MKAIAGLTAAAMQGDGGRGYGGTARYGPGGRKFSARVRAVRLATEWPAGGGLRLGRDPFGGGSSAIALVAPLLLAPTLLDHEPGSLQSPPGALEATNAHVLDPLQLVQVIA